MALPAKGSPYPVVLDVMPREGPQGMTMPIQLGAANIGQEFNLRTEIESGSIDFVQTVFVDNPNAGPATIYFPSTGATVKCPANSQGIFPVPTSNPADLIVSSTVASALVTLTFFNVPLPYHVWQTLAIPGQSLAGNNFATGQVVVGATATLIVPARLGRSLLTIVNDGGALTRLGPAGVTLANGVLLSPTIGATDTINTAAAVFGVTATTNAVSYQEVF